MAETVRVTIDRSSVAMGDDVESHREFWIFPAEATIDDLLVEISARYVPGVAGPAGWRVDVNTDELNRRLDVGLIYTRDDLREEDRICRLVPGTTTLGDLVRRAHSVELDVRARYMTWDMGRPLALSEVTAGSTYTGCQPAKLESEAAADAKRDWVLLRELDRRAAAITAARRSWIRNNIVWAAPPPPGSEVFVARSFHFLARLHCPASMNVAAALLGTDDAVYEDLETLVDIDSRPAAVIMAMVLAAFEWHTASRSWQGGERDYCKVYFEFLTRCGYQLSPVEEVLAGRITLQELTFSGADTARLERIRELRAQQYQLRNDRYYAKTLSDEQYKSAIGQVHAEPSALGELPGPM
ncbi:MAG: hypothetical protein VYA67_16100 [Actinomycetota bacterium]|uniref:Uncharacterized protein n=1 Tax=Mycobacterium lentiflavum TaxID=141349 RepID=A0ABY3USB8_MYCLN|nr:hypothetical protein [Mycobacterium lentiflavum]MEE3065448.1 hypothetical protein [Actinomycetota bacterium]ULP42490.1 hypothetical protein MJO58_00195 [Mycobacterium lentiflavum]